jgi:hypothetical protein
VKRTIRFLIVWLCFVLPFAVEAQRQENQSPSSGSTNIQRDKIGESYINEESDSFPCKQILCTDCSKLNDPGSEAFRITGILLRKDGSPLAGKTVYAYLLDKGGNCIASLGFSAGGTMDVVPHANSDAKGRFTIRMLYFGETTEFAVGVRSDLGAALRLNKPQRNIPVRQGADALKTKVERGMKEVDLGRIIVK